MAGATYTDLQATGNLEELYSNDTYVQQNVLSSLWKFIRDPKPNEVNLDGLGWNIAVQYALNESYGSKNDGERLPDPQYPKGLWAKFLPKLNYATIEMTSFAATRGYKGGRPDGKFLDTTLKSTLLSFIANLDADAYGNGRGYRATVLTATPAASSFTVTFCTRIRANMVLDWYNSALTVKRGTIKISDRAIDMQNRTVYIDSTVFTGAVPTGAAADDVLVVQGDLAAGEPSDGRAIGGFGRITDASVSLGNLSPSNYAWWLPTNINAGLQNPNELILQQHVDAIDIIAGVGANKLVISPEWRRAYMAGFLTQRRFTSNSFDTGMSNLTFSAVKMGKDASGKKPAKFDILEDKNQDPSQYFIFADDAVCKAADYSQDPHLADEDGADFRYRMNYDSMHGFMRWWGQLPVNMRRAIGRGYNFSTPSGVI
jgi:hypothetical protein